MRLGRNYEGLSRQGVNVRHEAVHRDESDPTIAVDRSFVDFLRGMQGSFPPPRCGFSFLHLRPLGVNNCVEKSGSNNSIIFTDEINNTYIVHQLDVAPSSTGYRSASASATQLVASTISLPYYDDYVSFYQPYRAFIRIHTHRIHSFTFGLSLRLPFVFSSSRNRLRFTTR